ncbi:MAG TPA: hypothetical protein VFU69_09400, partial [Ktedonobacterales bacterium]|nr:hypothetical protein [Ktedonobacterales bacterium]
DQRYQTAGTFAADLRKLLELGILFASQASAAPGARITRRLPAAPVAGALQLPGNQMGVVPAAPLARQPGVQVSSPAQPPDRPAWKPVHREPPPPPRSLRLAVIMTILVVLFLGGVIATAFIINR